MKQTQQTVTAKGNAPLISNERRSKILHGNWSRRDAIRAKRFQAKRDAMIAKFRASGRTYSHSEAEAIVEAHKTQTPRTVNDIPESWELVTGDNVEAILDYLGTPSEERVFGCLFVEMLEGEYGRVYGIFQSVPYLQALVFNVRAIEKPVTEEKQDQQDKPEITPEIHALLMRDSLQYREAHQDHDCTDEHERWENEGGNFADSYYSLRDAGRNPDGSGESYAERNA